MTTRPDGIGAGFGRLWTASTAGNLGDGVARVAIALLAVQLTRDPFAVAMVTALTYLPWLLFGLPAGVVVDRYDRRQLAMAAGAVRAVAVAVLAGAAATDRASLGLLYAIVLVLYTCETVYDNAVIAAVPMVVARRDKLERANGLLQSARLVADQFVGPPLAGMVFALGATYAFGVNVACYAVAALLLWRLRGQFRATGTVASPASGPAPAPRSSMRGEMIAGLRYILRPGSIHRSLLALMMALGFMTAMATATTVLWTLDVLGVSEALYGVFTLTIAVGAVVGSQTVGALADRVGRARTLTVSLAVGGLASMTAAATTSPYIAGGGLVFVGWASLSFNVVNLSLRQRLTPAGMLGRVTGIYRSGAVVTMLMGAVAGGVIASLGSLRLPWLLTGIGCLLITALPLRALSNAGVDRAIADADADEADRARLPQPAPAGGHAPPPDPPAPAAR
jgi:MFS family permease